MIAAGLMSLTTVQANAGGAAAPPPVVTQPQVTRLWLATAAARAGAACRPRPGRACGFHGFAGAGRPVASAS